MKSRFERFSYAVSEVSRYWHKIASDEMEKYGLRGSHAIYLVVMSRYDEGITATNLSEICGRDKADVSRAVAMMEKKGLAVKEGVNQSLYRARLKLTEEGKVAAEQVKARADVVVNLAGSGVSDEEREIFYTAFEKILDQLRLISEDGLANKENKES